MIVDAATLAGGPRNQDAYAVLDGAVLVLDGASSHPPVSRDRDGGWYARTLLAALGDRLAASADDLRICLADAIDAVRAEHRLAPGGPSSTVLVARQRADGWDLLALGDSPAVVERADGTVSVLSDEQLPAIARDERRAYRERLLGGGGYDAEHERLLARLQSVQRRARNREGGYWIAESDPVAARHALTLTLPTRELRRLALLTDGASAAVARYRRPATWAELLDRLERVGAGAVLTDVQRTEEADPDGRRWPRAKRHDDKTAVLLVID